MNFFYKTKKVQKSYNDLGERLPAMVSSVKNYGTNPTRETGNDLEYFSESLIESVNTLRKAIAPELEPEVPFEILTLSEEESDNLPSEPEVEPEDGPEIIKYEPGMYTIKEEKEPEPEPEVLFPEQNENCETEIFEDAKELFNEADRWINKGRSSLV